MYSDIKQQFKDLEAQLSDPELTKDTANLIAVSKKHAELKNIVELILAWEKTNQEISDSKNIVKTEKDPALVELAAGDLPQLEARAAELKIKIENELHPANPLDKKNAIMEIRAGAGGDESALFAADLYRMYTRFAENQGWKIAILNSNQTGIGGFKEIIFEIRGTGAYGDLRLEAGTHRVQRVPETEKAGRVHTSTATVAVLPEAEEVDLEIKPADIRVDTFCSSGPGGQSVNTTYSAIRILHIPTGLIVSCQDQKSQHQNREKALQVLRSRLLALQEEKRRAQESATRASQVGGGERSDKIRTYNFPQDRITDHRINTNWHGINKYLQGDLLEIIGAVKAGLRNNS